MIAHKRNYAGFLMMQMYELKNQVLYIAHRGIQCTTYKQKIYNNPSVACCPEFVTWITSFIAG